MRYINPRLTLTLTLTNVVMCLGNNQGNFQLHRFATSKNIANSFKGGATF